MSVNVTQGSGSASVAAEVIATQQYQQIKVVDGTAASTNKWQINSDGSAQVSVLGGMQVTGSVLAEIGGSVIAVQKGSVGAVVIGGSILSIPTGSVVAVLQSSSVIGVVTGSVVAIPTGNQSVSGTTGASLIGWAPIQASNTSIITVAQNSSIIAINAGSVVAISQGSVIAIFQSSSLIAINAGSVLTIPGATSQIGVWQAPSIVGTYAEDVAYTIGDKGLFTLAMRNDLMTSITSANLEYSGKAVGPIGEQLVANAPITKWVQGHASMLGGTPVEGGSVTVIAAQGASIFTYITSGQVTNNSGNNVFLTFSGATSSVVGYLPVPARSGALPIMMNAWKTNANGAFTASISGIASVYVSFQGFISGT